MRAFIKFIVTVALVVGVVCGALYLTVVDVWRIHADDPLLEATLKPSLAPGDLVVVSRSGGPSVGTLVRCPDPEAPRRFVVGRLLAEGGDDVDVDKDSVQVAGRRARGAGVCKPDTVVDPRSGVATSLTCRYLEYQDSEFPVLVGSGEVSLPPFKAHVESGKAFLVSDNRRIHLDSRDFGQVPRQTCQRVLMRLWSRKGWTDADHRLTWMP